MNPSQYSQKKPPGANARTYKVDETSLGWNYLYTFKKEGSKKTNCKWNFWRNWVVGNANAVNPLGPPWRFESCYCPHIASSTKSHEKSGKNPFYGTGMWWNDARNRLKEIEKIESIEGTAWWIFSLLSLCTPSRIEITYLESQTLSVHKQFPNSSCSSRHFFQTASQW